MRNTALILGVLWVGGTTAAAQTYFTVPAKGVHDHSNVGSGYIVPPPRQLPTRIQCLYSTQDLPAPVVIIREIAFQPWVVGQSPGLDSAVVTLTLDMSIGPRAPRKWSGLFSQNLGKTVTRVFAGKIQLPKITPSMKRGWYFRIPLKTRFVASKKWGPSLVFDFRTSSVVTKMIGRQWALIHAGQDTGSVLFQGRGYNCHFQKFFFLGQSTPGGIYVGSKWSWHAGTILVNQPGFLMLGDAGWGSKWAGLTLPIYLNSYGAPGCTLGIRPTVFLPFVVDKLGQGNVNGLSIPNDQRLANANFYLQGAYAYPKANALGMLFLPSLKYRIGSGEDHHGATVGAANSSPPSKWGSGLLSDPVPYCRITY